MGVPAAYNVLFMATPAPTCSPPSRSLTATTPAYCYWRLARRRVWVMGPARHLTAAFTRARRRRARRRMTSVAQNSTSFFPGVRLVPRPGAGHPPWPHERRPPHPPGWIAHETTHRAPSSLVRWRSRGAASTRTRPRWPPVALGDATLVAVDASGAPGCPPSRSPSPAASTRRSPNRLLRFAAGSLYRPRGEVMLVMRLAFVAADGTLGGGSEGTGAARAAIAHGARA